MEMLEPAALPDVVLERTKPCWYCQGEKPGEVDNKENEDPASPTGPLAGPENGEHNDASVLGGNLKNRPKWNISHKVEAEDPIAAGTETEVVPAAHHLLPGNASVNKAKALHKYMVWDGTNPKGYNNAIGYDINGADNGVWLPGNYAVRKETDFGKNWSKFKDPFKNAYARAAMKNAGNLQLHDAHPSYNTNVLNTLLEIGRKLDELSKDESKCPMCGDDLKDKLEPPYGLVGRLNSLSAEHRKPLIFTAANKKAINSGYTTSSRVIGVYS
jgi:HNH/ENDO VII superfamily nuclease